MKRQSDPRKSKEEILRHIESERWVEAFELMVRSFQDDIYRYCFKRLGPEDAADVAQEVFLAAWKGWPRIRLKHGADSIAPWLYAIARYKVLDEIARRSAERKGLPGFSSPEEEEPPDPQTVETDTILNRMDLGRALAQLPENDREVLLLYSVGFTAEESAGFLDTTPPAVRVRIHRAIKKLREVLDNG